MNHTGSNPQTRPESSTVAIVPARFASTRLPGKALLEICGKPMIIWVVERALAARNVDRVIVATDDERIFQSVLSSGHEVVMTASNHSSGTDRIAEAASKLTDADIIVNVQGDEPLIAPETIERAVDAILADATADIVTTWEPIETISDVLSPDVVKVVVDEKSTALYFSRSPIPFNRDAALHAGSLEQALQNNPQLLSQYKKHTGLYVYRKDVLLRFAKWPQTKLEQAEGLEQLRALEHGLKIKAVQASATSVGVDTEEDLNRVRRSLATAT